MSDSQRIRLENYLWSMYQLQQKLNSQTKPISSEQRDNGLGSVPNLK